MSDLAGALWDQGKLISRELDAFGTLKELGKEAHEALSIAVDDVRPQATLDELATAMVFGMQLVQVFYEQNPIAELVPIRGDGHALTYLAFLDRSFDELFDD